MKDELPDNSQDSLPDPTGKRAPDDQYMLVPEPGVGAALSFGWDRMKVNFLVFFLAVLAVLIMQGAFSGSGNEYANGRELSPLWGLLSFAYWLLFLPVINYGADLIFLRGTRGDDVQAELLISGFKRYWDVVLASLLVMGLIGIGMVMLVIPGIYIACRLVFTSYLVMDEGMNPIQAVEASWRITRGNAGKIFWLGVCSMFLFLFGLIIFVVGAFVSVMWIKASFAALYLSITAPIDDELELVE